MNIVDKVVGLLALGAILFYVFQNAQTTSAIINSLAGGFSTVEGSLQGKQSNTIPGLSGMGIPGIG